MGTLTLASFRSLLTFDLENRNDAAAASANLDVWINSAYSWMCQPRVRRHRELRAVYDITLATGDADYALDSTTVGRRVNALSTVTHYLATTIAATTTRRKLYPRSINWFEERTNTSGSPTCYVHEGDMLLLYGVPTSAENGQKLRVRYYGEPTPLSAAGDTTVLGPYWDRILRKASLAFAQEDLGFKDMALATLQHATGLLNEVPDDTETEEDTGHEVDFHTSSNHY